MTAFGFARCALGISAATALLVACGGSSTGPLPSQVSNGVRPLTGNKTFYYTGSKQSFTVPAGVRSITVVARGAAGSQGEYEGRGGRVYADIVVRPGETLYAFVGGQGSYYGRGGFNGGGPGGVYPHSRCSGSYCLGNGGGGASDVRQGGTSLSDRIIVAGGGGGAGGSIFVSSYFYGIGGAGGGKIGGNGGGPYRSGDGGGSGGTQSSGGSGGAGGGSGSYYGGSGGDGTLGRGGSGGQAGYNPSAYYGDGGAGGGGGGGYYGGGGGAGGEAGYASVYGVPGSGGGADRRTSTLRQPNTKCGKAGIRRPATGSSYSVGSE